MATSSPPAEAGPAQSINTTTNPQSESSTTASAKRSVTPPLGLRANKSSITPPPSSQTLAHPTANHLRPRSPTNRQLTSPPPTTQGPYHGHQAQSPPATVKEEDVQSASMDELRALVGQLRLDLNEARTTSAHFKLQYNMLRIDSNETQNRMVVELDMAQREIEVLQAAEERRKRNLLSPTLAQAEATTANAAMINELNKQRLVLIQENDQLRAIISQSRKEVEYKDGVLASQEEEIERLRGRIRKNREHMNGLLDNIYETTGSPHSWLGTPVRPIAQPQTPRNMPQRVIMPTSQPRENQPFEALLLADKFISQETATAPSTPRAHPGKRLGHSRGVHSLSSMPQTPRRQIHPGYRAPQTPPQSSSVAEPPSGTYQPTPAQGGRPTFSLATGPGTRRRASSDSTISATSEEAAAAAQAQVAGPQASMKARKQASQRSGVDEIPESQASQVATSMLRRTPVQKGGSMSAGSGSGSFASTKGASKLSQSKLTGRISKPAASVKQTPESEKKRMASYGTDVTGSPSKRSRGGHVGLGIGMVGSPR